MAATPPAQAATTYTPAQELIPQVSSQSVTFTVTNGGCYVCFAKDTSGGFTRNGAYPFDASDERYILPGVSGFAPKDIGGYSFAGARWRSAIASQPATVSVQM